MRRREWVGEVGGAGVVTLAMWRGQRGPCVRCRHPLLPRARRGRAARRRAQAAQLPTAAAQGEAQAQAQAEAARRRLTLDPNPSPSPNPNPIGPKVKLLVVDSIAFHFRHGVARDAAQRLQAPHPCRVQGAGSAECAGCRVQGVQCAMRSAQCSAWCRVQGAGCGVQGAERTPAGRLCLPPPPPPPPHAHTHQRSTHPSPCATDARPANPEPHRPRGQAASRRGPHQPGRYPVYYGLQPHALRLQPPA